MGPLLVWSLRFVEQFAADILNAHQERERIMVAASAADTATPANDGDQLLRCLHATKLAGEPIPVIFTGNRLPERRSSISPQRPAHRHARSRRSSPSRLGGSTCADTTRDDLAKALDRIKELVAETTSSEQKAPHSPESSTCSNWRTTNCALAPEEPAAS